MLKRIALFVSLILLTGCGLPPEVGIAGAGLGAADVLMFRGCIGVQISNYMPYNLSNPYECVPKRYVLPGAPSGFNQIIHGFTGTLRGN